MDRLFARIAWLCDWAGIFALTCSVGSLALHFWFEHAFMGTLFLFGVFRWLSLAVALLTGARVIELGVFALTGHDHYAGLEQPARPASRERRNVPERAAA
jgi:hypothetical protein